MCEPPGRLELEFSTSLTIREVKAVSKGACLTGGAERLPRCETLSSGHI